MIKYKKGNIFDLIYDNKYDIVLHGCNCFCKMDDGINLQFAQNFPEVLYADFQTEFADKTKLGTFIEVNISRFEHQFKIINCYTQFSFPGSDLEKFDYFEYEHFETIISELSKKYKNEKIGMPLIGSGHVGGDVFKILSIIEKHLKNHNVEVSLYNSNSLPPQFKTLKNQIIVKFDSLKDFLNFR